MGIVICAASESFTLESRYSSLILIENSDIESLYQVVPTSLCCHISVTVQDALRICCCVGDNLLAELETWFRGVTGSNISRDIGCPEGALILFVSNNRYDRLCDLVVRVSGYSSKGQGSIPSTTGFSEKQWVWNGFHSAS
jgi:hypothetical protein